MHAIASLNRIRSNLTLAWLASCLLALPSHAAPNPACPNGPLRVGFYKFGVAYRDGNGYDVDMVRELARRLHCPIASETELPRLRALKMLESGQIDLGTSTLATPDRLAYAWIFPYNHTRNMVLLHPSIHARALPELLRDPALRWGAIRGYRHSAQQDQLLAQMKAENKLVMANDEDDLFRMLDDGIVTAAFSLPTSYGRWLRDPQVAKRILVVDLFPSGETIASGLALSKARFSQEAAEHWHLELKKMYQDDSLLNILRRHLSEGAAKQMMQLPLD
ncbi:ABC transporter substrate-binding protein [Chromobacterium sinusclupearum]|uniref:ABC transporter substrate-binding protein n=1 Tax=Chromobacterium sinusclupearum TaxID=2077146 RepID=A0A2K4MK47_9NEIS|nr:ABC transporter substrate-binding protein [Chromobacterium sinusclupearum]POA97115.1 ABC transporter substrate-binding protein [Chromobacterium sinusclupearum]